jgi:hypothetical protein
MLADRFTKLALITIALALSLISLRPFFQTEIVNAQVHQSTAVRQKWEYICVVRTRNFPSSDNGAFRYYEAGQWTLANANGSSAGDDLFKGQDLEKLLPRFGEDGWELVTVEPMSASATAGMGGGFSMAGATDSERWIFKRPK